MAVIAVIPAMTTPNTVYLAAVAGALVGWVTAGSGAKGPELRVWDVLALGPWLVMLAGGRSLTPWERAALAFAGGATIAHNGRNFLASQRRLTEGVVLVDPTT